MYTVYTSHVQKTMILYVPQYVGSLNNSGECHINYLCTYDLYSPVHNVLDACISITWGSGRGLEALDSQVFWALRKTLRTAICGVL
jgi:hypothetical protein